MSITTKEIKTIRADLARRRKARLAVTDDRDLSLKETILRLAPELRRMKKWGFSTSEMIEALKENGLHIKGATLNRYLAESQPPKASAGGGRRKVPKAALLSDQESNAAGTVDSPPEAVRRDLLTSPAAIP
jgi:hypothetical protein